MMKKSPLLLSALLVAGPVASAAPAAPDPFHLKPGARGKACLGCHPDFEDVLKRTFVHTPVKNGDCVDCHNPHATDHAKMLAAEPGQICLTCHQDVVPEKSRSAHPDVVKANCVKCHDPHGSPNKSNLVAAGNDICFTCHKDMGTALKVLKFKHSPVEKSCVTCHDPHASTAEDFLLKKTTPGVCTDCHKVDQPAFVKQHAGYSVGKSNCMSCHDPHGSDNRGALWASVHPPVLAKTCNQCHNEPGAPNALKTKREGIDLCRGCHSDTVNGAFLKARLHWPVADRKACLNCHSPHAAKAGKLLTAGQKTLCGKCHADAVQRQAKSLTKHPPIDDGQCTACHAPHASNATFLLAADNEMALCANCHDYSKHTNHPIGEKTADQRNKNLSLTCSSCHRTHGSPFKGFVHFDPKMDLCVQCHSTFAR